MFQGIPAAFQDFRSVPGVVKRLQGRSMEFKRSSRLFQGFEGFPLSFRDGSERSSGSQERSRGLEGVSEAYQGVSGVFQRVSEAFN